jgi:Ras family protein A
MLAAQGTKPVTREQGQAVAKDINAAHYVECSAKNRDGVQEVFDTALREACKKKWNKRRVAGKNCAIL